MIHQTDPTLAVPESQQFLAQQLYALRLAVDGQIGRRKNGKPVEPHELTHGGTGTDPYKHFIIFASEHKLDLLWLYQTGSTRIYGDHRRVSIPFSVNFLAGARQRRPSLFVSRYLADFSVGATPGLRTHMTG